MHCLQIYILPLAVALFTHLHICRWLLHCLRICIFAARCYIVYEFSTHFLFLCTYIFATRCWFCFWIYILLHDVTAFTHLHFCRLLLYYCLKSCIFLPLAVGFFTDLHSAFCCCIACRFTFLPLAAAFFTNLHSRAIVLFTHSQV